MAVGVGGGQLAVDGDGFLGDGQRVGRAAQLGEPDAEVGQRGGRDRGGGGRAGRGQLAADCDGFLGGRQRVGRAAQLRRLAPSGQATSSRRGSSGVSSSQRRVLRAVHRQASLAQRSLGRGGRLRDLGQRASGRWASRSAVFSRSPSSARVSPLPLPPGARDGPGPHATPPR